MSGNKAEDFKKTLSAIFRRKGADGERTRLFDSLDMDKKQVLMRSVALGDQELAVLGNVVDDNNWVCLTTERLVWSRNSCREMLRISDISDAVVDLHELQRKQESKASMRELLVVTFSGNRHSVFLEAGLPLSGVWHVLKHVGDRNRRGSEQRE